MIDIKDEAFANLGGQALSYILHAFSLYVFHWLNTVACTARYDRYDRYDMIMSTSAATSHQQLMLIACFLEMYDDMI